MDSLTSLFDGEMHELKPGEDWLPVEQRVKDWAPRTSGESPVSDWTETEDLTWVFEDPTRFDQLKYSVAQGWAPIAVMLRNLSQALGGNPVCYEQSGRYYFQHKVINEEECEEP